MEAVSKVLLEVNGQEITEFKSFHEGELEIRKQFKLMNGTGVTDTTPTPAVKLTYVIPKDKPEFDFTTVVDGTITVDYQNGVRKTFPGAYTLKLGSIDHDGDKESTRDIDFATGVPITN